LGVLGIQETFCIVIAGLLERDSFDLLLPEFDKPWVIHLRETCCCSTNLCTWRPNTVYKDRSMHRHQEYMMMIILAVVTMMIGVMVIGVDGVIINPHRMSTLPIRFATFMGILLVIVGGSMVMIPVAMEIMEIKMPTSLASTPTGTMTLAPPTTLPVS
jgi:hypothetical protein